MRNHFAQTLTALATNDPRIVLLSGDIGNRLFDPFKRLAPTRFYNCGVAEANMIGVAAGLALQGLRPVCYTIAPFLTYRCLEQIRIDLCYHHLPVVLVGTGGGLAYANLGPTHQSCEELGMLRLLPNLQVCAPADNHELGPLLTAAINSTAPTYLRIGKKGEPPIHAHPVPAKIGPGYLLQQGQSLAIIACGTITHNAVAAGKLIAHQGIKPTLISLPTLKPLDDRLLHTVAKNNAAICTIEEHSVLGGLGSAVGEWLVKQGYRTALQCLGTQDEFLPTATDQKEARRHWGLDPEAIAAAITTRFPN